MRRRTFLARSAAAMLASGAQAQAQDATGELKTQFPQPTRDRRLATGKIIDGQGSLPLQMTVRRASNRFAVVPGSIPLHEVSPRRPEPIPLQKPISTNAGRFD